MKKIPSLFLREDAPKGRQSLVVDAVNPGCEWVLAGEGVATVKRDGTAVLVRDGLVYKRYDAKHGKPSPSGFEPCQEPDPRSGHWPGWLPTSERDHADAWVLLAAANHRRYYGPPADGTYEACGPMINGNNEHLDRHGLWRHGNEELGRESEDPPRDFAGLRSFLAEASIEGIVWHHPDGRMAKIKTRDFGHAWPPTKEVGK